MSGPCYIGDGYPLGREVRVPCVICNALLLGVIFAMAAAAHWIELTLIAAAFIAGALIF